MARLLTASVCLAVIWGGASSVHLTVIGFYVCFHPDVPRLFQTVLGVFSLVWRFEADLADHSVSYSQHSSLPGVE